MSEKTRPIHLDRLSPQDHAIGMFSFKLKRDGYICDYNISRGKVQVSFHNGSEHTVTWKKICKWPRRSQKIETFKIWRKIYPRHSITSPVHTKQTPY
jgi:hypothetical protein